MTPGTAARLTAIILVAATLAVTADAPVAAQGSPLPRSCDFVGGWSAPLHLDPLRLRALSGDLTPGPHATIRTGSRRRACPFVDEGPGLRLDLLPIDVVGQRNSEYAREALDGLRWAGKGFSGAIRGGVSGSWGPVSAAFAPVFAPHQNADFPILPVQLPGWSPFAYTWRPTEIDWPQRFGDDSFWWTAAGESYVRLDAGGVAVGYSTERLRWGPARRNPLMMSGAAPGFPHVFLGTGDPVDIWIGDLSTEAVWGHLAESEYFDTRSSNDTRLLAGLVVTLEPRGAEGLEIGFIRSYLATIPEGGFDLLDYLIEPYGQPLTNKPSTLPFGADNELFALFARWATPASGFEVYAEYARDDQWDGWDDLLKEPEHSAGFTAGVQKLLGIGLESDPLRYVRVAAEVTSLNFSETQRSRRIETIFYTHSAVRQGYTHRGQLLGAPIGPSSDAQSLEIDLIDARWLAGLSLERVRYANDLYWQIHADRNTYKGHDVELTAGLRAALFEPFPGLDVLGALDWSGRYNRNFIALAGTFNDEGFEHNLSVQIGASWTPASGHTAAAGDPGSPPTPR